MDIRGNATRVSNIGITQRATPLAAPWNGDLRVRFTDFQVNEISLDGNVVHLRTIGLGRDEKQSNPKEGDEKTSSTKDEGEKNGDAPAEKPEQEPVKEPDPEPEPENPEVSPEDTAILSDLAGAQFAQDVIEMYKNSNDPAFQEKKATAAPTDDRSKRGKIHHEVRRIFNSLVDTNTNEAGVVVASLAPKRGKKRGRNQRGGRNHRREDKGEKPTGEFLHFTLYKDNRDTLDAVNNIARMLHIKPQNITYAGTKDRRASTAQRCSVRYIRPYQLSRINAQLRSCVTGDYEYAQEPLRLGMLKGNEFVITIKNCHNFNDADTRPVEERMAEMSANAKAAMEHMAKNGWINYFGHQRFGTYSIGTHEVGKLILGEKYEEAINALLSYDDEIAQRGENGESPEEASLRDDINRHLACKLFLTGKDLDRAVRIMPRRFAAETCILRHLTRSGKQSRQDYVGGLLHITRGLRTMYLHAYQSYVWNHVVSRRWELYGNTVVKGDLVIGESGLSGEPERDEQGDEVINPNDDEGPVEAAHALTEEEASSGKYTIHDIVLPTPGFEVIYPDNEIGEYYKEFMALPENGGLDPHSMRRIRREFSLPGRYRRLLNHFLGTPSVEFKTYVDEKEQMHPTDLDILRANKAGRAHPGGEDAEPASKKPKTEDGEGRDVEMQETKEEGESPAGETKIAAVVKFQLGSSAYATVTLRELTGDPPKGQTTQ